MPSRSETLAQSTFLFGFKNFCMLFIDTYACLRSMAHRRCAICPVYMYVVFKLCIFLCNSHAPRGNQLIVDEVSV